MLKWRSHFSMWVMYPFEIKKGCPKLGSPISVRNQTRAAPFLKKLQTLPRVFLSPFAAPLFFFSTLTSPAIFRAKSVAVLVPTRPRLRISFFFPNRHGPPTWKGASTGCDTTGLHRISGTRGHYFNLKRQYIHSYILTTNKHKNAVERVCERNRGHTRVGCNARLSILKQQTGNSWVVNKFVEEHNHGLTTPSKVHLLRSHRKVSATKKALAQQFSVANIPTCQQLRLMEIDAGGPESVGCVERDLRNHERNIREELRGHDAETLIEYFTFEMEKTPNFFFDYETDSENKLVRCFWADSESRRSYLYFGDAMVFNTTYNTNKYSMIFAPFVGVNHHGQTTVFACGLLSDESTESFVWLLSKFLECMPRQAPNIIITDQDAAIAKAISMVMPSTFHRFCLWHILNKFSEKMNVMVYNEQYHMLVNIIKNSESSFEFEERWSAIMVSTSLDCNEWLTSMYELRARWVPAYVKHIFSAGMSSSQRSETTHSFFKRYVNRKNSLMDFITRFNMALRHQRHEELVANHIDLKEQPRLTSRFLMENQMVHIYTKKIFLLFQTEVDQSNNYICSKISGTSNSKVYMVERFEPGKSFDRQRQLTYCTETDFIYCSYRTFDFDGYPCRHMISYFRKNNASLMARHGLLANKSSLLVDDAALTDARTTLLMREFDSLHIRIKEIDDEGNGSFSRSMSKSREQSEPIGDPTVVRAKGCGKRLKSSKEKSLSKNSRQCRCCGENGHDKRTCPRLNDRSNMEMYQPNLHDLPSTQDDGRDNATLASNASSHFHFGNWFG
ncbi:Protein FAR1-RELATED SEQUENCE 5 [Abeliophyllum distichum]|uniref:Protein FAR1-RELATED SEQUENCE 5 n=1 Tax=Abeliophyllum distichum TaxID=126358 RepID=A0ABD1QXW8_9LAMI